MADRQAQLREMMKEMQKNRKPASEKPKFVKKQKSEPQAVSAAVPEKSAKPVTPTAAIPTPPTETTRTPPTTTTTTNKSQKHVEKPTSQNKAEEVAAEPVSEIPAGFFDDRDQDRKARKVDVSSNADLMKVEFEAFQAEVQGDLEKLEEVVEDDDDSTRLQQDEAEQHEQTKYLNRIERLRTKIRAEPNEESTTAAAPEPEEADSVDVAEELEEFNKDTLSSLAAQIAQRKRQRLAEMDVPLLGEDDDDNPLLDWRAKSFGNC
eukprot:c369_g1_i1.p2 GENE.c369_g1_i1~~c369_g1_i1.p2  ORF type:complete len:271 (+),score=88.25 c369_g1_i1:26-814(+)